MCVCVYVCTRSTSLFCSTSLQFRLLPQAEGSQGSPVSQTVVVIKMKNTPQSHLTDARHCGETTVAMSYKHLLKTNVISPQRPGPQLASLDEIKGE